MKYFLNNLLTQFHRIDRRTIQLMILVIVLMLFVLVAGAPDGGGSSCTAC
jgi:hypothetical protein